MKMLIGGVPFDENRYASLLAHKWGDPFKLLIMTMLSQNTSDFNALKAYEQLSSVVEISPKSLASLSLELLSSLIRPAGLYKRRAFTIHKISEILLEHFDGDLKQILNKS